MIKFDEIWKLLLCIAKKRDAVIITYHHHVYSRKIYFELYSTDGLVEEYTNGKFWADNGDFLENAQIGEDTFKTEFLLKKYGVRK